MKHVKKIAAAGLTVAALAAVLGVGSASATTLEVGGVTQNQSVSIVMTLKSGTSLTLKDEFFETLKTCTQSELAGSTGSPFSGTTVTAKLTTASFANCSRPVTVHKGGTLHIEHIKDTTNGTVAVSGSEWTTNSVFGYLNCKTGLGTHLGTLKGVKEGHAEIVLNASIGCSGVAANWSGTYIVTSPTGLGVSA